MHLPGQNAFLQALGWALLHSFWQYGLLWFIFYLFISPGKRRSSAAKHGFALVLVFAGLAFFSADLCFQYYHFSFAISNTGYLASFSFAGFNYNILQNLINSNLVYLSYAYLLVVTGLFLKFLSYFLYAHKLQTRGISKAPARLRLTVEQLALQLGIRKKVQLWISELVDTPMIVGFIRPTILVPLASINQLTVSQLEAILLHELAHIKRNDYLLNLFVALVEILFFFNPFVKLFIKSIEQERENSCDDRVLQFRFNPHQYASALLLLEQNRTGSAYAGMAATGHSRKILLMRIQRIMTVSNAEPAVRLNLPAYIFSVGVFCLLTFFKPANADPVTNSVDFSPADKQPLSSLEAGKMFRSSQDSWVKLNTKQPVPANIIAPQRRRTSEPVVNNDEVPAIAVVQTGHEADDGTDANLVMAVDKEQRDYSIPETEQATSLATTLAQENMPYVPSSSFSYFFREDTTKPKLKKESSQEKIARVTLIKARKAMEQIDWDKIQKQLKTKVDVAALRKQIDAALGDLNWQQINQEVSESVNKETLENMKASLTQEYEQMKMYKKQDEQYEKILDQVQETKENARKDAEQNYIKVRNLSKIKVVVHI